MTRPIKIHVKDRFQDYTYILSEMEGKNFAADFKPELTPKQMLKVGVFGGEYFANKPSDLPADWFIGVKLDPNYNAKLNYYGVKASQPRSVWLKNVGFVKNTIHAVGFSGIAVTT
jgi:hypothetical protein